MEVKISSIEKFLIVLFLLMQLSYFKLFGDALDIFAYPYNPKPLQMFYFFVSIIIILFGLRRLQHASMIFWVEIICCVFPTAVNFIIEASSGVEMGDLLGYVLPFWYVLLAVPILGLLQSGQWKFDQMIQVLIILITGALLIRMAIVFVYSVSGSIIFSNIALESAGENWIRDGRLRVNPCSLHLLLIPISYYWIIRNPKKRMLGIIGLGVGLIFPMYATQARSMTLYGILTVLVMYLFQNTSEKKKLLKYFISFLVIVAVINTKQFNAFVDSFSINNSETGGSTAVRLEAVAYYGKMFLENPILGNGFTNNLYSGQTVIGNITDIGIVGALFRVGIFIAVFYLLLIYDGFSVLFWKKSKQREVQTLLLGCAISIMLTEINIDCFVGLFALSVPFVVAFMEYFKPIQKRNKRFI